MKKYKIIFWITTGIIFLFEGVMVAFTSQTEMAVQGITHLGYPVYFGNMLAVFKVVGTLALIIPAVPRRVKEWAYAGFMIDFISALVGMLVVDGWSGMVFMPIVFIGILIASYVSFDKLNKI
jgi:DoxX-like family